MCYREKGIEHSVSVKYWATASLIEEILAFEEGICCLELGVIYLLV